MFSQAGPRSFFAVALALALALLASPALAQSPEGAPYTPRTYERSELIDFASYAEPPLELTLNVVDTSREPHAKRLDFVFTLDMTYDEARSLLEDEYMQQEPLAHLGPGVMPFRQERGVHIIGHSLGPNKPSTLTVGSANMTRRFVLKLDERNGQAIIRLENVLRTRHYSGVMPARTPFQPAGAKPIPFLWN